MKPVLAFALAAILPLSVQAEGMTLTVEGIRNDQGNVLIAIFDQALAFEQLQFEQAVDWASISARKGAVTTGFPALTDGPYAVFLFHDENGDEDLNMTGEVLLEGVGASGAPDPQDVPSFPEAAVPPGAVRVTLHYDW